MQLIAVPPALASQAWPKAREFVYAASKRVGLSDAEPIEADVLAGRALLWLAADGLEVVGAGVTQIFTQAGHKVCEIVSWGARDQARCAPLLNIIEEFARAEECTVVRLVGRKGWARHLKSYGLRAVILEKAL